MFWGQGKRGTTLKASWLHSRDLVERGKGERGGAEGGGEIKYGSMMENVRERTRPRSSRLTGLRRARSNLIDDVVVSGCLLRGRRIGARVRLCLEWIGSLWEAKDPRVKASEEEAVKRYHLGQWFPLPRSAWTRPAFQDVPFSRPES